MFAHVQMRFWVQGNFGGFHRQFARRRFLLFRFTRVSCSGIETFVSDFSFFEGALGGFARELVRFLRRFETGLGEERKFFGSFRFFISHVRGDRGGFDGSGCFQRSGG